MTETPEGSPLVEQEGVNAQSRPDDDDGVMGGGHPEDAPDPNGALTGYGAAADDEELVGAPDEASQEHQSSGQDSGSMD